MRRSLSIALVIATLLMGASCTPKSPNNVTSQDGVSETSTTQDSGSSSPVGIESSQNEDNSGVISSGLSGQTSSNSTSSKNAVSSKNSSSSSKPTSSSSVSSKPDEPKQELKKPLFVGISPTASVNISEDEWKNYREMGIKTIRVHLQAGNMGSTPGKLNFYSYDKVVNRAKQEGIEVIMLLSYESYKSTQVPQDMGWGTVMRFTNSMDLIPIAQECIQHFKTLGVRRYEIWNEQNGMWQVPVNEYVKLITTLYEKCKYTEKWDTNAIISFGGLDAVNVGFPGGVNGGAKQYVQNFYASSEYKTFKAKYKRSPFDAFSIHPYNTIDVDADKGITSNTMANAIKETIIKTMDANGDVGMPIWITEYGNQDSDNRKNARAVYESILEIYKIPQVEILHWFKYTYGSGHESNYSIVWGDGEKRPSYHSFVDAVDKLYENEGMVRKK